MKTFINDVGDLVCEHGTVVDVHCCNCHSGFLFDADSCVCTFEGDSVKKLKTPKAQKPGTVQSFRETNALKSETTKPVRETTRPFRETTRLQ